MTEAGAAVPAATTSLEVRQDLVDAIRVDLVGPGADHKLARERLPANETPSNWYLTRVPDSLRHLAGVQRKPG